MLLGMGCCLLEAETEIHERGYWIGEESVAHQFFDSDLAEAVADFFVQEGARSVVDFGCGTGEYIRVILDHQIPCEGCDGNPDTPALTKGLGQVLDFSVPVDLEKRFDWVLSLETGEHLPKDYETTFIENLDRHNTKGIVLSWAVQGQSGFGHFNCQDNDYVKAVFAEYGYVNDPVAEATLRKRSSLWWFQNTIMVFRRPD
jgi:hypothetical protein